MPKSPIRRYFRRRRKNDYTLYGIIAGVAALLAVAMLVYPRYDRVQDFFRGRKPFQAMSSGRYNKSGSSLPRGHQGSELRTENEILESGRTRTDNL